MMNFTFENIGEYILRGCRKPVLVQRNSLQEEENGTEEKQRATKKTKPTHSK